MLDALNLKLNNSTCNPYLSEPCSEGSTSFSEKILGNSPAEAIVDELGTETGGPDSNEDFVIWRKTTSSSNETLIINSAEMNVIKTNAI